MENHVVLNFRKKRVLGIVLGKGFKQMWGICSMFYECSFVFIISFSCDLLKRKKIKEKRKKGEYKKQKFKTKKIVQKKRRKKMKKCVVVHFHSCKFLLF